ncbi:MAG: CDP-diacylglycerol--glycerol-3-phosphate 3-phosphatidyltransferase [Candidatus Bipolaricaulota bacterium]|nr:CDP-diacylglycerol--glycerol-3-phosphate 3-phosphatidyltransferase [Candidatus Bipolaricaulota bacterium]MCS7273902.1 CDP-diacylglycerol--glycerol-3-phosphate 3-phosphatidyltransferase [Candidatus Bipolaricaulota bacterium]MDW8110812.1 CDP-diacylglycerol--glycerol-3-phosphate 3-phosphatidyltransferase [Candidatus Bipolaricaulota bacterium]MDW8328707.1 CDP-diacylglycerol--glycerol-3-phosphate 3-phosphatidyltransferase [Candidatus Bipolaricaulota bacterium]
MNLPNALTLLRVLLIPFIVFFLFAPQGAWPALVLFLIAALSDLVDGYIARRRADETDLGKIADPIADKLLVLAVLLVFVEFGRISSVPVMVLLAREFLVSGLRIAAGARGRVIAAGLGGKLKTISQMALVLALLGERVLGQGGSVLWVTALLWLTVVLSVVSGAEYFYRYFRGRP